MWQRTTASTRLLLWLPFPSTLGPRHSALSLPLRFLIARRHDGVDTASDVEIAHDCHAARPDGPDEVVEDAIRDGLVEVPLVPERPQIQLERLQLHTQPIRDVPDADRGEVRLSCARAETGELRALEADLILTARTWVGERLERLGWLGRHLSLHLPPNRGPILPRVWIGKHPAELLQGDVASADDQDDHLAS